jgi:acetyl-CoA C-acetyltransferase
MLDAYIYDGLRTPFGRHGGVLAPVRPDDLLGHVIRQVVERSPFAKEDFEDVVVGCVCQSGEDSRDVARFAGLLAGLPVETGGLTVNRLCGSGMSAVLDVARSITLKEADLYIAGGTESMTRAPLVMGKAATPFQRTFEMYDSAIGSRFPNPRIAAQFGVESMPETADNIASDFDIGREASDAFAYGSQQRFEAARAAGFFEEEICATDVPQGRKQPPLSVTADEHPRPDTTLEKMASLRPLFEGGVVTAANASGINDGAGALIMGSRAAGEKAGAPPRGRIVAGAIAGVAPRVMGVGPAYAIPKALARAGLEMKDMDVIEINEAFATQVLGCCKILGLDADDPRLNPNGGAIAVGHPLGASGARITLTALRQLERTGGKYALVSMCIGVGQGIAMVIERV